MYSLNFILDFHETFIFIHQISDLLLIFFLNFILSYHTSHLI